MGTAPDTDEATHDFNWKCRIASFRWWWRSSVGSLPVFECRKSQLRDGSRKSALISPDLISQLEVCEGEGGSSRPFPWRDGVVVEVRVSRGKSGRNLANLKSSPTTGIEAV